MFAHNFYRRLYSALSGRLTFGKDRLPRVAVIAPHTTTKDFRLARAPGSTHVRLGEKLRANSKRPVRYDWVDPDVDLEWLTSHFQAVIVQRTALDDRAAAELVRLCRERKCALIVDLDDFLLSTDATWPSYTDYSSRGPALKKLLNEANLVIASTEELKNRLNGLTDDVMVSPNALSERLWFAPLREDVSVEDLSVVIGRKHHKEKRVIYMGSFTHDEDLKLLTEAVSEVRKTYPNFRLFTVGVTRRFEPWHECLAIPNTNYPQFVPWFRRVAKQMDFAVAPLVDTEFNRAKSALKILEYAAASLPVVASDVTPYREVIEHGKTGFLVANNPSAWAAALRHCCENPDQISAIAERQRKEVERSHSLGQFLPKFDAAILSAIERVKA